MFDGEAFGAQMVEIVRDHVERATAPLLARIETLERRELVLPEKGEPGEPGAPGDPGQPGAPGKDGADGVGLADALIDKDGHLVLTLTDGRTKNLGPVHGQPGEPGKDGADGLGFEHMTVEQVNERTLAFLFKRDAEQAEVNVTFPVPIYRGVYSDSATYEAGDLTTWAGSLWHCNEAKGLKPGSPDSGWQLAAKAGRPGKDAK